MSRLQINKCELCGEDMPPGEDTFKYHGFSGPCPKPPLPTAPREPPKPTRLFDPKNIPVNEPVFLLRGQDSIAADLVELWALRARAAGTHQDKVLSAFAIAEEMRRYSPKKDPD